MSTIKLRILITDPKLVEDPAVAEKLNALSKQGHEVTVSQELLQYDFITGPNCWYLRPEVAKLFELAIKNARKIANADQERAKQPTVKKDAPRKPRAARKPRQGNPQVTGVDQTEGPNSTDPGANAPTDSQSTGGA